MNDSASKTFFVMRRDKVFGPFTAKQIENGRAASKYQDSDLISESATGPWIEIAHHFAAAKQSSSAQAPPVVTQIQPAPASTAHKPPPDPQKLASTPQSNTWKYVAIAVIGFLGLGFIGVVGLVFLAIALVAFSADKREAQIAAADPTSIATSMAPMEDAPEASLATNDSAASNPPDETSGESSIDDVNKMLGELNAMLAESNRKEAEANAQQNAQEDTTGAADPNTAVATADEAPAPEDYGDLSDEHQALSAKEAAQLAMKMLSPAQREANGATARLLLNKAAAEGDAGAMYFLSLCYLKGWGGDVDKPKGAAWLKKSAQEGDLNGMFAFSTAIRQGMYADLGPAEGRAWRERAANAGHQAAAMEIKREQVNAGAIGVLGAMAAMPKPEKTDFACSMLPLPRRQRRRPMQVHRLRTRRRHFRNQKPVHLQKMQPRPKRALSLKLIF